MRGIQRIGLRSIAVTALSLAIVAPAVGQQSSSVSQDDIMRLQDNVYLAERDVSQLQSRDAGRAAALQSELDELGEEVIYLKVKLRKEGSLARSEYADVRDRIDGVRTRARNEPRVATPAPPPAPAAAPAPAPAPVPAPSAPAARATATVPGGVEIPSGTELDVRLQQRLNSGSAQVEDRFEGTTLTDLGVDGRLAIPSGAVLRGVISNVQPATRTNRTARMTLSFDQVTFDGRSYPIRVTVTQALEGEGIRGETGRTAAGATVGGIIGGILGGFKGAMAGVLIGGGGTIAATEGRELDLPQGTVLRVRFDSPVQVQPPAR